MLKFKRLLYNKLTLGLVLTTFASLVYAVLLKFSFEYFFQINPIKGGLSFIDLSFFLSIATWRIIIGALFEALLGDKYHMSMIGNTDDISSTALKTEKGKNSPVDKPEPSGSGPSSKATVSPPSTLEYYDLFMEASQNLGRQYEMVKKLRDLKLSKDLKYYLNEGALEVDVPASMSDEEVNTLSKQVGIMDRIYNTKYSEYKNLLKRDAKLKSATAELRKMVKDGHNDLFDK